MVSNLLFGFGLAGSREEQPKCQALSDESRPQAWLQGGTLAPLYHMTSRASIVWSLRRRLEPLFVTQSLFAMGDPTRGHGYCSCGRCICEDGWFGKLCQFPRSCDMSDAQSKELCERDDGVICSGKGSCHCGRCICSPQEWWVSGDFCECDDRECDKHDGLICT
ncbi:hypothetical protein CHARACLAT_010477, partial [Characodon lateralis]|nr:hypothetical protein [Characodon lateralis]